MTIFLPIKNIAAKACLFFVLMEHAHLCSASANDNIKKIVLKYRRSQNRQRTEKRLEFYPSSSSEATFHTRGDDKNRLNLPGGAHGGAIITMSLTQPHLAVVKAKLSTDYMYEAPLRIRSEFNGDSSLNCEYLLDEIIVYRHGQGKYDQEIYHLLSTDASSGHDYQDMKQSSKSERSLRDRFERPRSSPLTRARTNSPVSPRSSNSRSSPIQRDRFKNRGLGSVFGRRSQKRNPLTTRPPTQSPRSRKSKWKFEQSSTRVAGRMPSPYTGSRRTNNGSSRGLGAAIGIKERSDVHAAPYDTRPKKAHSTSSGLGGVFRRSSRNTSSNASARTPRGYRADKAREQRPSASPVNEIFGQGAKTVKQNQARVGELLKRSRGYGSEILVQSADHEWSGFDGDVKTAWRYAAEDWTGHPYVKSDRYVPKDMRDAIKAETERQLKQFKAR